MLGRLKDLTINRDGTQNITITIQSDFREMFDELADKDINIEIKKWIISLDKFLSIIGIKIKYEKLYIFILT